MPDYSDTRTFATQRIEQAVALEETFSPVADAPSDVFPDSLGAISVYPGDEPSRCSDATAESSGAMTSAIRPAPRPSERRYPEHASRERLGRAACRE